MERIARAISANLGAKIVAVVFAVVLWFHVTAQQQENQSFRVPLVLAGIPESLTVIHGVPESVDLTIRGARSNLIKIRLLGRLKARIDLSTIAGEGRVNIPMRAGILNLSEEIDPRNVTIDSPKNLSLNVEPVVSRQVPVRVAFRGEIPEDLIVTEQPTIIPERVTVRGAASLVGGVTVLSTTEIDIRNRRGKVRFEADIAVNDRRLEVTPARVMIEMATSRRGVRTLANIPPTLLQTDGGPAVEYRPRAVSLTIEGPEEAIARITAEDVSVIIDITSLSPGTYRIEPEIIVPKGIERYWLDVDAFEITIPPPGGDGAVDEKR
ncbi:MAG: hypothetical protein JW876_03110 [Candidatus Krumholzibacteriota bacterium]|nr:hypothetical protein [Candidatus Krumholzibacteriota bacterium]